MEGVLEAESPSCASPDDCESPLASSSSQIFFASRSSSADPSSSLSLSVNVFSSKVFALFLRADLSACRNVDGESLPECS